MPRRPAVADAKARSAPRRPPRPPPPPARLARPGGRRHTPQAVRRWRILLPLALASPLALGGRADAKPRPPPPAARAPERPGIWSRITDPNGDEVRSLVGKARLAMRRADDARAGEEEWAIDQRTRFYRDAYNLAAYARKLAPENLDALATFARAAEELGQTREAIAALERSVQLTGADKAATEVVGRLGALYLRAGDTEQAIRWLRLAEGPESLLGNGLDQAHAVVHLATALAARGEMAAALRTLGDALPPRPLGRVSDETTILTFALAVLYDRDEQRASAFEALDRLQAALTAQYEQQLQLALARMRFLPPEDLYYYRALLYESLERYTEARAEWALYAAAGQPTYRGRALDHIAAIDAQRRANPGVKRLQPPAPPRRLPVSS
jgi:tetratricopeptide (TPR) repeat protein